MATEKIAARVGNLSSASARDQAQLAIMLNALMDGIRVVTAKLDADAGVTDVNYTALFDAVITK